MYVGRPRNHAPSDPDDGNSTPKNRPHGSNSLSTTQLHQ
ncbi:Uncharacterised protein [Mycobacterium tuberculosis]|nr:hypothetical protein BTB1458_1601 [Mycobacterium tuberculosis]EQM19215.1 hypothetical protein GuangZ0019_2703 [Mycobacterium tuberculosis GuangZ0019]COZ27983.1 Uncharacterised protein [Mycobacterium tuberculosis]COZ88867.1 Uncharacterised protein [Mycobacterium tuberculosis]